MSKRVIKAISLILATVLICSVLTGCNALDTLRDTHAKLDNEGNIVYKGNTYMRIDASSNKYFSPNAEHYLVATEPDVPLLLSYFLNTYMGYITDDDIIMVLGPGMMSADYSDDIFYCREDKYKEVKKKLSQEFLPEVYGYSYYYYDDNGDEVSGVYTFTKEQTKAMKEVIASPALEDKELFYSDDYVDIYEATEDLLFKKEALRLFYSDEGYFVENGDNEYSVHAVPEEMTDIFDEILETQRLSDEYWGSEYEFYYDIDEDEI
ncbi:MAG: hypothetical protein IKT46_00370 [Clostridia bacterium]|nr:hypothetical protein [Clostridia bacterium]